MAVSWNRVAYLRGGWDTNESVNTEYAKLAAEWLSVPTCAQPPGMVQACQDQVSALGRRTISADRGRERADVFAGLVGLAGVGRRAHARRRRHTEASDHPRV